MIVVFALFLAGLALFLQKRRMERCLDLVKENHWPDVDIVEPDQEFHIVVSLKNLGRGFVPFLRVREYIPTAMDLRLEGENVIRDSQGGLSVLYTVWLKPRQELRRYIPVSVPKRGRCFLREMVVSGGDFLGIHERTRNFSCYAEVVTVPRPAPEQTIGDVLGGFLGDVSVSRFIFEDPVLTLGYREYTGREPMKMISWAQSARGTGLMVKKYDYTLEPAVTVLVNVESLDEGREERIERSLSLARTVCETLEERGIQYDFATNSVIAGAMSDQSVSGEGLGRRHFMGILESLGRATYAVSVPADALLEKSAASGYGSARGRILITPDETALSRHALARLREAASGNLLVINASEVAPW